MTTLDGLRCKINLLYLANEPQLVNELLAYLEGYNALAVHDQAHALVTAIRAKKDQQTLVESFLHEYQLNSA